MSTYPIKSTSRRSDERKLKNFNPPIRDWEYQLGIVGPDKWFDDSDGPFVLYSGEGWLTLHAGMLFATKFWRWPASDMMEMIRGHRAPRALREFVGITELDQRLELEHVIKIAEGLMISIRVNGICYGPECERPEWILNYVYTEMPVDMDDPFQCQTKLRWVFLPNDPEAACKYKTWLGYPRLQEVTLYRDGLTPYDKVVRENDGKKVSQSDELTITV